MVFLPSKELKRNYESGSLRQRFPTWEGQILKRSRSLPIRWVIGDSLLP